MYEWVAKTVFELFTGTAEDKERAQEQLKPVLERRFEPCRELWKIIWQFADNMQKKKEGFPNDEEICQLSENVDSFVHDYGVLISSPCLVALLQFQISLREIVPCEEDLMRSGNLRSIYMQITPSPAKDEKGKVVGRNPGLLMLLRDEIGSNARAAFSVLKQ